MTPTAMKRELQRLGLLTLTSRNLAKLELRAYVPPDETDVIQILGIDTVDLINTICHNAKCDSNEKRFQRKLCYVNIPVEHIDEFFAYAESESQSLLERMDIWLAGKDDDFTAPEGLKNDFH